MQTLTPEDNLIEANSHVFGLWKEPRLQYKPNPLSLQRNNCATVHSHTVFQLLLVSCFCI